MTHGLHISILSVLLALVCGPSIAQTPAPQPTSPAQAAPRNPDQKLCSDPATQMRRDAAPSGKSAENQGGSAGQTARDVPQDASAVPCPPPEVAPGHEPTAPKQ